nr:uncharacterized protein LOC109154045 [Ipomoea batatas]
MVEQLKMFGSMSNGLIELVTDCEVWDLVKQIELHNAIEIWVVSDDGVDECEDVKDDIEFETNVNPSVEFGGIEEQQTELTVNDGNIEINFSNEGSEKNSDFEEEQEYTIDGGITILQGPWLAMSQP